MNKKLPRFESLDELVEFWETHDFTDYLNEMEEVDPDSLSFERNTLYITLAPEPLAKLTQIAAQQGTTPNTLAQTWLEERLGKEIA